MKQLLLIVFVLSGCILNAQKPAQKISVIAYYAGDATHINAYPVEKLTHIIFSFCHLKGNELHVDNKNDSLTIQSAAGVDAKPVHLFFQLIKAGKNLQLPLNS